MEKCDKQRERNVSPRLTGVFAAFAGGEHGGRRHVLLLEQERGRRVIVVLDGRQPLVRFVVHGRVVAVLRLVADVATAGHDAGRATTAAGAAVQRR